MTMNFTTTLASWQQLDAWLSHHADFWQPVPFYTPEPSWAQLAPDLWVALRGLTEQHYQALAEDEAAARQWLGRYQSSLLDCPSVYSLDALTVTAQQAQALTLSEVQAPHMPARKRHQAGFLAAQLQPYDQPLVDWCSGAGHLARTLAMSSGRPVLALEKDAALVARGTEWIQATQCPDQRRVTLQQQDVLSLQADSVFWPRDQHCVALHACGDLHRHLLRQAVAARQPRISLVPCCYHLTQASIWQPLAQATRVSALQGLTPAQMRLAVQETVTAPDRVTAQRHQLNIWRLGYEALRQQLAQDQIYRPLASCSVKQLRRGFATFCAWAAEQQQLSLPEQVDWDTWWAQGQQRYAEVQRDELLRHQFRRPLELWLLLDYVLFLQEAGYQVHFSCFCERRLSPRNLLIDARLAI
ncbi:methyltransferase [Marinospirillum sp.]|uniref:methyltransferase n=1 Tax=Marinospirillum sp. TaxID=2183934 RepID=UPI003A86BA84